MIGEYANPFDELLINSWINSASISYSQIFGLMNFNTLLKPFPVISHALFI